MFDLDYQPKLNEETGREELPNPERGCGFLKHGKGYIRADVGPDGSLSAFVEFETPIPYKEGTLRSYQRFPGIAFELSVQDDFPTDPEGEVHDLIDRLDNSMVGKDHFGKMVTAYAHDLLMWVGGTYYDTPGQFITEARQFGLNKGIPVSKKQGPPPIHPGQTRCFVVHPRALEVYDADGDNPFDEDTRVPYDEGPDDADPVEHVPGIVGYSYLTRVVWTTPKDGDIPKWAKEYEDTGKIDIVDVGEQVPAESYKQLDGFTDVSSEVDADAAEADDGDSISSEQFFEAVDQVLGGADDGEGQGSLSDAADTDDSGDSEREGSGEGDTSDHPDEAADDDAGASDDADDELTVDDLPDNYNELKSMAADVGADVSPQPSQDELEQGILEAENGGD